MATPYPAIADSYRERLLKVLTASDVYTILREIRCLAGNDANASVGRAYLFKNWNDNIRDRVVAAITDKIDLTKE